MSRDSLNSRIKTRLMKPSVTIRKSNNKESGSTGNPIGKGQTSTQGSPFPSTSAHALNPNAQ